MNEQERTYYQIGQNIAGALPGQLFGKPCFKRNEKAFACFFRDCMVFKLTGSAHQEAIELEGSTLFDPSGKDRPMKEWVQVPYIHKQTWQYLAKQAAAYTAGTL